MGELVRFFDPKREKIFKNAAENAKESIYASVSEGKNVHCDDVTIALARSVYHCFYAMQTGGLSPAVVCNEIDDFIDLMRENLPKVKRNIWSQANG
jgi:phosphoribosyl-ATP pyrophosphohydrolase